MTMRAAKRRKLEKRGWKLGDPAEFLGLSDDERALLELKSALGQNLRARRIERQWTQVQFAEIVRSSQSRVAKMESGDPAVSLDLLVRSLLATGMSRMELAEVIRGSGPPGETGRGHSGAGTIF
jgi:DNA-binding XRE family transcriptional regulator